MSKTCSLGNLVPQRQVFKQRLRTFILILQICLQGTLMQTSCRGENQAQISGPTTMPQYHILNRRIALMKVTGNIKYVNKKQRALSRNTAQYTTTAILRLFKNMHK